jgi:2-keto-4-pentenoate hydratase/acetyl esterase/lipase
MKHCLPTALSVLIGCLSFAVSTSAADAQESFSVWPGTPPGATSVKGEMRKLEGRPRPFYQLADISEPIITVFAPPPELRNGTAILVCPGGGLQRLAYEHEGIEVSNWLRSQGITAFLLRYRVPAPIKTCVMDAQRAMSLIRSRADEWGIDSDSIGTIGFSAGGEMGAWLVTHVDELQYEPIDDVDQVSNRPDFAALIYPGGLLQWRSGELKDELASRINGTLPPIFIVHAFDDSSQNSLAMAQALKQARVPTELHMYHEGGHGFGARDTGLPLGTWKARFTDWLSALGYLDSAFTRVYARAFLAALNSGGDLPRFSEVNPSAKLADAYVTQKRVVKQIMQADEFGGFKGAGASAAAQESLGIDQPLMGVLLKSGHLKASDRPVITLVSAPGTVVETEIGFIVDVDISYEVLNDQQAQDAVSKIVPVIELPVNYTSRLGGSSAMDMVASNIGSARFIVGDASSPADADPNKLKIKLERDGELLHETTGGSANAGQWHNLRSIMNQITGQGYTIRAGTMIICGALGQVQPGEAGKYVAKFGELGSIEFELK